MKPMLERFYAILGQPIEGGSRVVLALLVIPLGLSFLMPLWNIHMVAPQYPQGLDLHIFAHTVKGDINEINTLNHYIGMQPIHQASLSDLDWIPFALGALILLTLRVAAIGDVRSLIDVAVLFGYFSIFSVSRFYYQLYVFGHNLDPRAPFEVEPFTPAILGTKQVANFTTSAFPGGATYLIGVFALGLFGVVAWHLVVRLRRARRSGAAA